MAAGQIKSVSFLHADCGLRSAENGICQNSLFREFGFFNRSKGRGFFGRLTAPLRMTANFCKVKFKKTHIYNKNKG